MWIARSEAKLRVWLMKGLVAALIVAISTQADAQPIVPSSGAILQQIQPVTLPAYSNGTGVMIEQRDQAKLPNSAPFLVQTLQISGNTLFATPTLHALVADAEGKSLTLSHLGELAARITGYYQSRGYPLARAIIPSQTIESGIVRIQVIEATYGGVSLSNSSRVKDTLLQVALAPLQTGKMISQTELDSILLQIADIPGVVVGGILKPGDLVGTSNLLVSTTPGPMVTGNIALNNYGDRYTGKARIRGTLNIINPLHHGDVLSVAGLSSGSGLNYGSIAYEFLLNGQGARIGGSYTALRYELGEPLASLKAHGSAQVKNLWVRQQFVRSRDVNLYGKIQYEGKQLRDRIDTSAIRTDRHQDSWTLNIAGDAPLLGSFNSWSLNWTSGRVGFDNSEARLADAAAARTHGGFSKWNANLSRLQSLGSKNALYLAFSGQWANTNLDPAEKTSAGGPVGVRAFDVGALSGDAGYLVTVEFQHDLGSGWNGRWQAVAFFDMAHIKVNENAWVAGTNSAILSGAGIGLNWVGLNQWRAKTYIATQTGAPSILLKNSASTCAWFEISRGF